MLLIRYFQKLLLLSHFSFRARGSGRIHDLSLSLKREVARPFLNWDFPKIRGTVPLGILNSKDPTIQGTILWDRVELLQL